MSSGENRENEQNNFDGGGGSGWHNNEDTRGSGSQSHNSEGNLNSYNSSTVDNSFSLATEHEHHHLHQNFHQQQQNFRRHHVLHSSSGQIMPSTSRYHPYPSPSSSSSSSTSSSSTTPPQSFPPAQPHSFQEPLPRPLSTCPPTLRPSSSFSSLHPPPNASNSTQMSQLSPPVAHHNIRHTPSAPPLTRKVQEAVEFLPPGVVVSSHQEPQPNAPTPSNHVYDSSVQSQALDLRILPLKIESPPQPHEFAVPMSSPSTQHHRPASVNFHNADATDGMPNDDPAMFPDVPICRCGKCTNYHNCNNYSNGEMMNCIENHRIRFFRSCDSCDECRQRGQSEAIQGISGPFGENGGSNMQLAGRSYQNCNHVPMCIPSQGPSSAPSQPVYNRGNYSSPMMPQLPPAPPPPPPPPTPKRAFLNPVQPRPDYSVMPDSAIIKHLLEMLPSRQTPTPQCTSCAVAPVPQPVPQNSLPRPNLQSIPEVTRLQMLLTTNNQYGGNGRNGNDSRLSDCRRTTCNNRDCTLDSCQIRLVSTASPQVSTVPIQSPQPPPTPFRLRSEPQSTPSLGIMIPLQPSQSDAEARVEQMTLRRASPSPPQPPEETGEQSPVSPQTAAAFAAANTLVTMTIPKSIDRPVEEGSPEETSPQSPPEVPSEETFISTTTVIRSPSHTISGGVVVSDISPVVSAPLHQLPLPPMRPPSMGPPPPLMNTHQVQPFFNHEQNYRSQSQEFSVMRDNQANNMLLHEQHRQQQMAAQQHAQQSFHRDHEGMPPVPPNIRFQQNLQQHHQQFPVNPRSLPQYNPNLEMMQRNASQQKAYAKHVHSDICGNGNTVYGEAPPPPQRRIPTQLQQQHSMPNHNNLPGLTRPELLYSSASFQQQQQQHANRFAQYTQPRSQFQQQPQQDYHRSTPFPMMGGQLQHQLQQHQHQQRYESAHQSSNALNPWPTSYTSMNSTSNMMAGTSSRQMMMNNNDVMRPRFMGGFNRVGNSSGGGGAITRRNPSQPYHPYHNPGHFQPRNIFNVPAQLQQLQQQQQQYQQLQRRPPPACTATSQHPGHGHYELLRAEPPSMFGAGDHEVGGFQANECLITREPVARRESGEARQLPPNLPSAPVTEETRIPRAAPPIVPIAPMVPSLLGGSSSSSVLGAGLPGITLTRVTPESSSSDGSARIRGTPISVLLTTSQRNAIANASNALANTDTVQQPNETSSRGRRSRGGSSSSRSRGGSTSSRSRGGSTSSRSRGGSTSSRSRSRGGPARPVGRPPKQRDDNGDDNGKPKTSRKQKAEQSETASTRGRGGKRGRWRGITLPPFDGTLFDSSSGPINPETRIMPIDSLQGAGGTITTQAIRPAASVPLALPGNVMINRNRSNFGNNDQSTPPTQRATFLAQRRATCSEAPAKSELAEEYQRSSSLPAESSGQSPPKRKERKKKAKPDRSPLPVLLPLHAEPSAPPRPVVKRTYKKSSKESSSPQNKSVEVVPGTFEMNSAIDRIVQQYNSNTKKTNPPKEAQVNSRNPGEENEEILSPQPTFRIPEPPLNMLPNITAISVQHNVYQPPSLAPPPQLLPSLLNNNRGAPRLPPMPQLHARPGSEPDSTTTPCPLIRQILQPTRPNGPSQFDISLRPVINSLEVSYPDSIPPLITLTPSWREQSRSTNPFDENFQNSVLDRPLYPQLDMVPFNVADEVEVQAEPCENEEVEQQKDETKSEEDKPAEGSEEPQKGPETPQEEVAGSSKSSTKGSSSERSEDSSADGFGALIICEEPEKRKKPDNNEDNQDEDPNEPKPGPSSAKPSTSRQ